MSDNIWDMEGEEFNAAEDDFEMGGGNFDPVPAGFYFCIVESAEWKTYDDVSYIQVTWVVVGQNENDPYANRKIFQKLKVHEDEREKRIKHRKQLSRLNQRLGGVLPTDKDMPTDEDLMAFQGGQLWLNVLVWEIKNESTGEVERSGNWVNKVGTDAKDSGKKDTPVATTAKKPF